MHAGLVVCVVVVLALCRFAVGQTCSAPPGGQSCEALLRIETSDTERFVVEANGTVKLCDGTDICNQFETLAFHGQQCDENEDGVGNVVALSSDGQLSCVACTECSKHSLYSLYFPTTGRAAGDHLELQGVDDYNNNKLFDDRNELTISAWIRPILPMTAPMAILSKGDSVTTAWYLVMTNDCPETSPCIHFHHDGFSLKTENTEFQSGDWYHIAVTYTAFGLQALCVNGVQDDVVEGVESGLPGSTAPVIIGESEWSDVDFSSGSIWRGNLDEIAIWADPLTEQDIQDIYNNGVPTDLTEFTPPPTVYYRMGDSNPESPLQTISEEMGTEYHAKIKPDQHERMARDCNVPGL